MRQGKIDSYLDEISSNEFEQLVAEIWEKSGYETEVTQGSHDRGIDVVARKQVPVEETVLIQAKSYSQGNKIGSSQIQQYSALKHQNEDADRVVIITTSSFTSPAEDLAKELDVDLIDRGNLVSMIERSELDVTSKLSSAPSGNSQSRPDESIKEIENELFGTCSACGSSNIFTATCSVCGEDYCTDCRKPFQHGCRGEPKKYQGDTIDNDVDTVEEYEDAKSNGINSRNSTTTTRDSDSNPVVKRAKHITLVPMWIGLVVGLVYDIRIAFGSIPVGIIMGYVWMKAHDVEYLELWS